MNKERLQALLHQYLNNTISESDCIELLDYLEKASTDKIADAVIIELIDLEKGPSFGEKQTHEILQRIQSDARFKRSSPEKEERSNLFTINRNRWLQIAAAFLLLITGGVLYILLQKDVQATKNNVAKMQPAQILPGSSKAYLTMGNGKVIYLSNATNGVLAKINTGNVLKPHNGQIVYKANTSTANDQAITYNTLTTPKGGEYQVVLPDGTKVWLNAASSLSYPTAFTGNERHVKLTGEAYFEVAKNKAKPFFVTINDVQVRVLGTHFNIEAYSDDSEIKATLLEGSVQVTKNKSESLLKPGQQAVINNNSNNITVADANIDDVMAWKNGYFIFDHDNITGIMKKVSRWYDVDIEYNGNYDDQKFGGTFYRSKNIAELLQHLEKVGKVHFTITGRRIIVMN
jgi:transmembrane sensor